MTDQERFNRALDIFVESLLKPDHELRNQAREFGGLEDLLKIRDICAEACADLRQ